MNVHDLDNVISQKWLGYVFKPIAEQFLRSNETIVPQRLVAASGA